jgi:hypothetical protein
VRFSASLAFLVYLFALRHHLAQAGFADLPSDGALALRRAVDIAMLQDLPARGNSIGPYYWFGVADDYLLAPFLVGAANLEVVLRRSAMFHALCAPIAFSLGAILRRPLMGLAFGLSLAALPDLVNLSGSYPLNYRTTHWALLALAGTSLLASSDRGETARQFGAAIVLVAASLAVASHPFGIAALPAALLVCISSRVWPRGRLAWACLAVISLCLFPYFASNLDGLKFTLFGRGSDTRAEASLVLSGSLTALKNLSGALSGLPGGSTAGLMLLSGAPLCAFRRESRPALILAVLWILGAYGAFLLAGYPPKTWHLRPCLYLGLGLGFIGWTSALSWLLQRTPSLSGGLAGPRLPWAIAGGLCIVFYCLKPAPHARADSSPVRAFGELSTTVLEVAQGRPFQYIEAQSHCPLNWSAEATMLDLHLRSGDFSLGTHEAAPLLAAIQRVGTFEVHNMASPVGEIELANGLSFRLHWSAYPQAWREQLLKYCPNGQTDENQEAFYLGGPARGELDSPCWVQGACSFSSPLPDAQHDR